MPQKITVFFRKDREYRVHSISGVWGGITPQGTIHCDLYFERPEAPESVNLSMDESGVQEVSRHPATPYIVRELMVGITMIPGVARSIGQWLIAQADETEKRRGELP